MAGGPRLGDLGDGSPPMGSRGKEPVGVLGVRPPEAEALSEK